MIYRKTSLLTSLILAITGVALVTSSAEAQRRFQLGGPFGIGIGGGQGLTIGGGNGVQLGGGQGLRFGPPNVGVQYGGGQGVRYGTPNRGVQFGGGQVLRYGGPNNGIRVGGGQGVRVGTPQSGAQFRTGNGLQTGPLAAPTFSRTLFNIQRRPDNQFNRPTVSRIQPSYNQPIQQSYGQPVQSNSYAQTIQPTYQQANLSIAGLPASTANLSVCDCTEHDCKSRPSSPRRSKQRIPDFLPF